MCQDGIDPAVGGTPLAKKEFQKFKRFNSGSESLSGSESFLFYSYPKYWSHHFQCEELFMESNPQAFRVWPYNIVRYFIYFGGLIHYFWKLLSLPGTCIQNCQTNDVLSILPYQYIILHFNCWRRSLGFAETHIKNIGFLVIVNPYVLCWQLQHVCCYCHTVADEILRSLGCYCRHTISPYQALHGSSLPTHRGSRQYDTISHKSVVSEHHRLNKQLPIHTSNSAATDWTKPLSFWDLSMNNLKKDNRKLYSDVSIRESSIPLAKGE